MVFSGGERDVKFHPTNITFLEGTLNLTQLFYNTLFYTIMYVYIVKLRLSRKPSFQANLVPIKV